MFEWDAAVKSFRLKNYISDRLTQTSPEFTDSFGLYSFLPAGTRSCCPHTGLLSLWDRNDFSKFCEAVTQQFWFLTHLELRWITTEDVVYVTSGGGSVWFRWFKEPRPGALKQPNMFLWRSRGFYSSFIEHIWTFRVFADLLECQKDWNGLQGLVNLSLTVLRWAHLDWGSDSELPERWKMNSYLYFFIFCDVICFIWLLWWIRCNLR